MVGSPSRELEVARVGDFPLRKRQTSWKQPLAEAATRCEPLRSSAARLLPDGRIILVVQRGLCQHQRRNQTAQWEPSAWPRAKLHDVSCHIIHKACCEAGLKSQREVIVPTLATEKLTEPLHGPHNRLDFTVVEEALRYSSAVRNRTRRGTSCGASGASEDEQVRESEGVSWSRWHLPAAQRTI